jgi:hypothetical protein
VAGYSLLMFKRIQIAAVLEEEDKKEKARLYEACGCSTMLTRTPCPSPGRSARITAALLADSLGK